MADISLQKNEDLEKLHHLEIKIAMEIKRVCKKHNIKYFLAFGSLLGAIRHKGFIPWDDDLDIGMLRDDYERFIKVFNDETDTKIFFMENWDTEPSYGHSFTKIKLNDTVFEEYSISKTHTHKGIFVDVFPFDSLVDNPQEIRQFEKRIRFFRMLYKFKLGYLPTNPSDKSQLLLSKLFWFIGLFVKQSWIKKSLLNQETKYNRLEQTPPNVVLASGARRCIDYFDRSYIDETIEVAFDGVQFAVPKEYHKVLTRMYGDYMQLPPVEQRTFRHSALYVDFGPYK